MATTSIACFSDSWLLVHTWKLFSLAIVNRGHDAAVEGHAFGYQLLTGALVAAGFPEAKLGVFDPVVDPVPTGAVAVALWDHIRLTLSRPYSYERKQRAERVASRQ